MSDLDLQVFSEFEAFAAAWKSLGYNNTEAQQYWALLEELSSGELLIHLPEWLADDKVGYHDGATPVAFVGRIDQETEQAIRFVESAAARKLSQRASQIQHFEESIERLEAEEDTDPERLEWLQNRLEDERRAFEERKDVETLAEEWLPKSQLEFVGRRAPTG